MVEGTAVFLGTHSLMASLPHIYNSHNDQCKKNVLPFLVSRYITFEPNTHFLQNKEGKEIAVPN
jgi:hypothetical protein